MKFTGERCVPGESGFRTEYEHYNRYFLTEKIVKDKEILDVGSGEGYGAFLLSFEAKHVVGIDVSEETILHAKNKYIKGNIEFIHASATSIPFEDNSFDVVNCFEVIEHISESQQKEMMEEIRRVLKEDGILIISSPNKKVYSDKHNTKNPFHIKELYFDEFESLLNLYYKDHIILGQRMAYGSLIFNFLNNEPKIAQIVFSKYSGSKGIFYKIDESDIEILYFVAICSNNSLQINNIENNHLFIDIDEKEHESILKLTNQKNEHIIELNKEVEKSSNWAKELEKERNKMLEIREGELEESEKRLKRIYQLQDEVKELSDWGRDLDKQIAVQQVELSKTGEWAKEIERERNKLLEIREKELEESEKRLKRIYQLQDEVKELSDWGRGLDKVCDRQRDEIYKLQNDAQKMSSLAKTLEKENNDRSIKIQDLQGEIDILKDENIKNLQKIDRIIGNLPYAQLYFDTGEGFVETQSIKIPVYGNENQFVFDLSKYSNIKQLRFDPLNDIVSVYIFNLTVLTKDNRLKNILLYNSNAFFKEYKKSYQNGFFHVFDAIDPQIYIDLQNIGSPKKFIIQLQYETIGKGGFYYDQKITQKDQALNHLYNSPSWKVGRTVTFPLRMIKKILNKIRRKK